MLERLEFGLASYTLQREEVSPKVLLCDAYKTRALAPFHSVSFSSSDITVAGSTSFGLHPLQECLTREAL
jgi:hypothetical protein